MPVPGDKSGEQMADEVPVIRSASEQEFINQKTRDLMVAWCNTQVTNEDPDWEKIGGLSATIPDEDKVYLDFAKSKGWISKDGLRILSAGWDTASRFLKR